VPRGGKMLTQGGAENPLTRALAHSFTVPLVTEQWHERGALCREEPGPRRAKSSERGGGYYS